MPKPITPDLVYQLTSVSQPSITSDGAAAVFTQSRVDRDGMETRSRIMLADMDTARAAPFTNGQRDTTPRFSPNAASISFVRPDDDDKPQLWVISLKGGEARKLTSVPGGVTDPAWSPDSRSIAFVSDVNPDRLPDDHDHRKDPRVSVVSRIRYRADGLGWRGDAFRHIFVVDVETGGARQLTHGEGDDSAPAWSSDGTRIAFISDRRQDREIAAHSDVFVIPAAGSDDAAPELRSEGLSSVAAITWSPRGDAIAAVASDDDVCGAGWQSWIFVLEEGKPPRRLTDDSINPAGGYAPSSPRPKCAGRPTALSHSSPTPAASPPYTRFPPAPRKTGSPCPPREK